MRSPVGFDSSGEGKTMSQSWIRQRPTAPPVPGILTMTEEAGEVLVQGEDVIAVPAGQFVEMVRTVARLADRAFTAARAAESNPDLDTHRSDSLEPDAPGLYLDRDGDMWAKEAVGWRLILQHGFVVDPMSLWDWIDGCVRDYGPFTMVAAN